MRVTQEHLHGWVQQSFDQADPDPTAGLRTHQRFVVRPATPPRGVGSLRFKISNETNPNRVEQFRTPKYDRRLLRDLRGLTSATFQRSLSSEQMEYPAYLRLTIDTNGDTDGMMESDESLFFYPSNNQNTRANPVGDRR